MTTRTALFSLGQVVATPAAMDALTRASTNPATLLNRRVSGDWENVPPEDAKENEIRLKHGFRIMSSYVVGSETIWITTEENRQLSTMLTPADY